MNRRAGVALVAIALLSSLGCGAVLGAQGADEVAKKDLTPVEEAGDAANPLTGGGAPTTSSKGSTPTFILGPDGSTIVAPTTIPTPSTLLSPFATTTTTIPTLLQAVPPLPGETWVQYQRRLVANPELIRGSATHPALPSLPGITPPEYYPVVSRYCDAARQITAVSELIFSGLIPADFASRLESLKIEFDELLKFAAEAPEPDASALRQTVLGLREQLLSLAPGDNAGMRRVVALTSQAVSPAIQAAKVACGGANRFPGHDGTTRPLTDDEIAVYLPNPG